MLQVLIDNNWQYVFCYNEQNKIITTTDRNKALKGIDALLFFSNKYSNNLFRIGGQKNVNRKTIKGINKEFKTSTAYKTKQWVRVL